MAYRLIFAVVEFFVVSLIVYLFYFIFMINRYDKNGKLKKKKKKAGKIINLFKKFLKISEKDEILLQGRKNTKIKSNNEIDFPSEVELLITITKVDLKKINYKSLLKITGFVCAIDIGLILSIISLIPVNNIYISIFIGFILVIPVILISYNLVSKIFKKKGLVRSENRKRTKNRK